MRKRTYCISCCSWTHFPEYWFKYVQLNAANAPKISYINQSFICLYNGTGLADPLTLPSYTQSNAFAAAPLCWPWWVVVSHHQINFVQMYWFANGLWLSLVHVAPTFCLCIVLWKIFLNTHHWDAPLTQSSLVSLLQIFPLQYWKWSASIWVQRFWITGMKYLLVKVSNPATASAVYSLSCIALQFTSCIFRDLSPQDLAKSPYLTLAQQIQTRASLSWETLDTKGSSTAVLGKSLPHIVQMCYCGSWRYVLHSDGDFACHSQALL